MRAVEPHDLELFAINTGAFYERHKQLARAHAGEIEWRWHVRVVVDRYSREVEPVYASGVTIGIVAANLQDYYTRHIKELDK